MTPLEWLTAGLVVVNMVFAWQMVRSVTEMKRSRQLQVMPKLAPDLHVLGPALAFLRLTNVGLGPALDVRVKVVFEGIEGTPSDEREWRSSLFAPGEFHEFLPPQRNEGGHVSMDELTTDYRRVAVKGTAKDSLGRTHTVDEASDDLNEWWQVLKASGQRMDQDYLKRIADEITEIRKKLK